MELKEFQQKLIDKAIAEGFEDAEIYFQAEKTFQVKIFEGNIEQYKNSISNGISFRGTYKNNMGYAFSERIDELAIDFIINEAKQNAEIIEDTETEELFGGSERYVNIDNFNVELKNVPIEEKIQSAKNMEKSALEFDKRIKSVDWSMIAYSESEISIQNTKGLNVYNKENYIEAFVESIAEENNQTKLGAKPWIGNDWNKFSPVDLAQKSAKEAISYLGAETISSGEYPILLRNDAATDLFETFVNIFFADNVQKGFSLLKGKLNQKIANDKITIKDDAICESVFKIPFDSEGVATYNKTIIENGILKTYLHNTKTAKKDGVLSTGNGFKASYNSQVKVSATNFYIVPTDITIDKLMETLDNGLMITTLEGLHSGTNTISGDFSLAASGYIVEDGKIIKPVEQITMAGNFFELLNNIQCVGNDLKFNAPSSVGIIGSPSLYIKSLAVAGL